MSHFPGALSKLQQYKNAHNPLQSSSNRKLPPLQQSSTVSVQGNALTIHQQKQKEDELRSSKRFLQDHSKDTLASSDSDSLLSPIQGDNSSSDILIKSSTIENEYKKTIDGLESLVLNLKLQLESSENSKEKLQKKLLAQEEQHNNFIQTHQEALQLSELKNEKLAQELNIARDSTALQEAHKEIMELKRALTKAQEDNSRTQLERDKEYMNMKTLLEAKLATLQQSRDQEIAVYEEKLSKLKRQMADSLTGNSRERQQQIDDLMKELQKVQEEEKLLKQRLKTVQNAYEKNECANCSVLSSKLQSAEILSKEQTKKISELERRLGKEPKR